MAPTLPTLKNWANEHYDTLFNADQRSLLEQLNHITAAHEDAGNIALLSYNERPRYGLRIVLWTDHLPLRDIMTEFSDLYADTTSWIIDRHTTTADKSIDALLDRTSIPHILKVEGNARDAAETRHDWLKPEPDDGALYECYGGTPALKAFLSQPEASYKRIMLFSPNGIVRCTGDVITAFLRADSKRPMLDACGVIDHYLPPPYDSDEYQKWDEDGVENDEKGVFPSTRQA